MTYQYMLDTNILSDLVRHPQGKIFKRIATIGEDRVCTSIIVACELRFGAVKRGASSLGQKVNRILEVLSVLPLEPSADLQYAAIRTALEQAGTPIGPNDLLIAAHALSLGLVLVTESLGLVLVTDNTREFERVPNLRLENWL
jgi:tRNA(fMet)-specific endonuclease VapC